MLAIMHFGEISIVAGRVNKKAGSYIHDVYIAAAWMLQQGIRGDRTTWGNSTLPSKHFLFSKTSSRRLQRNTFRLPRRLEDVFAIRLPKMSSRRLQDVFARRIAIMSSRRLGRQKNVTLKTS